MISITISGVPVSSRTTVSGTEEIHQLSATLTRIVTPRLVSLLSQPQTISTLKIIGISLSVWPEMVTSSLDPIKVAEIDGPAITVTSAMVHL